MQRYIIDIIIVAAFALCAWRGYRAGIINGICGIIALIIAVYGANLIANTYSGEVVSVIETFASGVVEGMENEVPDFTQEELDTILGRTGDVDVPAYNEDQIYVAAYTVINRLGVYPETAASMAREATDRFIAGEDSAVDVLTAVVCERVSFIAVFLIAFLLIAIVFSAIGNVIDISFGLPGIEIVNNILGALLHGVKFVMVMLVIGCVARYLGLFLKGEAVEASYFLRLFMENNPLSDLLGI